LLDLKTAGPPDSLPVPWSPIPLKILFLTQVLPFPPDAGPKVKTWHILRYLAECGHHVTLASFVRPDEQAYVPVLKRVCDQVYAVPIHRSHPADIYYWLRSQLTGRPFLIERDGIRAMHNLVRQTLFAQEIDVIHADQLGMTQFALRAREQQRILGRDGGIGSDRHGPALVFDAHNAVWTIVERMEHNAPAYLKPVLALEAHRLRRYEGRIVCQFDHTLVVTEIDQRALSAPANSSFGGGNFALPAISVIPIAVDTEEQQPVRRQRGSTNILTLGTLHYPPNADGIRWFMHKVFPLIQERIPEATLTIIGRHPPKDILALASKAPTTFQAIGYVSDLTPYFERAALTVVPVRAGGGMRVRILEASAHAIPVVTTTIGLEGFDARPGEDVLVADTPADFAGAVVRLLQDESLQSRLAANGRRLAEQRYDWKVALKALDAVYNQIEKQSAIPISQFSS
jgi:glycosyltransferase involved in cell wall biosynthesis